MFPFGDFDYKETELFSKKVSELTAIRDKIYKNKNFNGNKLSMKSLVIN